jgi:hypothetical protein
LACPKWFWARIRPPTLLTYDCNLVLTTEWHCRNVTFFIKILQE